MANTYLFIASAIAGAGGASTLDFTSIPNTYTDLMILGSIRSTYTGTDEQVRLRYNGNALGTNFTVRLIQGAGSGTPSSSSSTTGWFIGGANTNGNTTSTFTNFKLYVPNYTASTNKSFILDSAMENNATLAYAELNSIKIADTAAISSLSFFFTGTNKMAQYSSLYLYGIKKN